MIKSINIENIALIEKEIIEFSDGLNIISGETGAGKSIIINALCFALGSRADKSLIRNGQEYAKVSIEFEVESNPKIDEVLRGMDVDPENTIIIVRKMSVDGKNEIKVNGIPQPLAMLKRLTMLLCDVYGQFEHSNLLDEKKHLQVLDDYGAKEIQPLLNNFSQELSKYKDIKSQIQDLGGNESERARKIDFLNFQINEIDSVSPMVDEDVSLEQKKEIMTNAEKLKEAYLTARQVLDGDDYSARTAVSNAKNKLNSILNIDSSMQEFINRIYSLDAEIDDISSSLNQKADSCDFDVEEFMKVDNRLDAIKMLKRKYGKTIAEILETREESELELNKLINAEETIAKLNEGLNQKSERLKVLGTEITKTRKKYASQLENDILSGLKELGMGKAQIVVDITAEYEMNEVLSSGFDKVEFLFSANLGEPVKPLSKIISGGELSRFMLAFKSSLAKLNKIGTQVYDEIDAGISGHIGQVIAKKLSSISKSCQVITISHLPQIVSMADSLFKIEKFEKNEKTYTQISKLDDEQSLSEIARLSGGENIGKHALEFAKEMKQWAKENK